MADEDLLKSSLRTASNLGDILASLPINDGPEQWSQVELTAQSLANALRIKDPKGIGITKEHGNQRTIHSPQLTSIQLWGRLYFLRRSARF